MTPTWKILLAGVAIAGHAGVPHAAESFGLQEADRIAVFHAEGAQIYECARQADGTLAWKFKEPVASLFDAQAPVGIHFRGPSWEFSDGSVLSARVVAQAPAQSKDDIPHLALEVTSSRGTTLALARSVMRFNTKGGRAPDVCTEAGKLLSVPYSADYAFYVSEPVAQ